MKVLIAGATGFIGKSVVAAFQNKGYSISILSRNPDRVKQTVNNIELAYSWNPEMELPPEKAFEGVDTVINLAGENIADGRWTKAKKQRIHDSRVLGTRNLVKGMIQASQKPKNLISGSAIGFYGDRGAELLSEESLPGTGFLPETCVAWEGEAFKAKEADIDVTVVRTGIVLGQGGGALAKMLPPFKACLGGRLGEGQQWMSWIHVHDLAEIFLSAAEGKCTGIVNGVSPTPVTNLEFTRVLAETINRPAIFPVPEFILKIVLGEMSQILTGSQYVIAKGAHDCGFPFRFQNLESCLKEVLAKK